MTTCIGDRSDLVSMIKPLGEIKGGKEEKVLHEVILAETIVTVRIDIKLTSRFCVQVF